VETLHYGKKINFFEVRKESDQGRVPLLRGKKCSKRIFLSGETPREARFPLRGGHIEKKGVVLKAWALSRRENNNHAEERRHFL